MDRKDGIVVFCSNCGGNLIYNEGIYLCENCGNKQKISSFFENTEVFICYVENDFHGRRTKDSAIAQDLYNKLQGTKINTFYQRISIADLTGTEYQMVYEEAINRAKIILVLGTTRENFEKLLLDNQEKFASKKIIPIYSKMDAYDIPQELRNLQALNYDNIGMAADLSKNILRMLGRENEIDVVERVSKERNKRKRLLTTTLSGVFVLAIIIGVYMVFGTPYVLNNRKYAYAEKLMKSEKYVDAINMYSLLGDYENSINNLTAIFNKYDGYYQSDDKKFMLHLDVIDNVRAQVEISITNDDKKLTKIIESYEVNRTVISGYFTDSDNSLGQLEIMLQDTGISVNIKFDNPNKESFNIYLMMANKSDAPIQTPIDAEMIINWVTTKTTEDDLLQRGYEIELENNRFDPYKANAGGALYKIKDTDIYVMMFADLSSEIQNKIVQSVLAPAELLAKDRVGKVSTYYIENDILYLPNPYLFDDYQYLNFWIPDENKIDIIEKTSLIGIISKNVLYYDDNWDMLIDRCNSSFSERVY